jgi:hypothetical protein
MTMKKAIFPVALLVVYLFCSAHFIWIETPSVAWVGKAHKLNVFYGEYAENIKEEQGKRLEEVKGLTATIVKPDHSTEAAGLTPFANGYKADFTPSLPGLYEVLCVQNTRDVIDWSKHDIGVVRPIYYSRSFVLARDVKSAVQPALPQPKPSHDLDILPLQLPAGNALPLQTKTRVQVYFRNAPLGKAKLFVYAPNGWMKELDCDDNGVAAFTPEWKGLYLAECIYKERVPGTHNGKAYEAIRHRCILSLNAGE